MPSTKFGMLPSVQTLFSSIVDYAGLFPPSKLHLSQAIESYARHKVGNHRWMLGRFVLPSLKLGEFEKLVQPVLTALTSGWELSLILSDNPVRDIELALASSRWKGDVIVSSLEIPALELSEIDRVKSQLPDDLEVFFEVPRRCFSDADHSELKEYVDALAAAHASGKVRTGGVSSDAFPSPAALARWILFCAVAQIPFKATAGLHHPLRGAHRLTYETDSPSATMHGFLNVLVAAALTRSRKITAEEVVKVLKETSTEAFRFRAGGVACRDRTLDVPDIEDARRNLFRSFGSCSFQESVDDLEELKIL